MRKLKGPKKNPQSIEDAWPGETDIIGLWLSSVLTGKRERYLVQDGKEVQDPKVPGEFEIRHRSNSAEMPLVSMGGFCVHGMELRWDQWVVATIKCMHGDFTSVSGFFNITEAITNAVFKFNESDHPNYCNEKIGPNTYDICELWQGHEGKHGPKDDGDDD